MGKDFYFETYLFISKVCFHEHSFKEMAMVAGAMIDKRVGDLYALGIVPYSIAWRWQQQLVSEYKNALVSVESIDCAQSRQYAATGHSAASEVADGENRAVSSTFGELVSSVDSQVVAKDSLVLLQHPSVYTLGQGADDRFLRFDAADSNYELHRVDRKSVV